MTSALHTSALKSLPLLARGKVRDNYAVGDDRILMVASDRISAFDVIMGEPIPGKGALLTKLSLFWFDQLGPKGLNICPTHLTGDAPEGVVSEALLVDWRNEGTPGGFDLALAQAFARLQLPFIAFGGLSEPAQLRQLLDEPHCVAVAMGNFLSWREHAVQAAKHQLQGLPLRPPAWQGGDSQVEGAEVHGALSAGGRLNGR